VTPTSGDYNPANNTANYCFTIVNSLDPNEKEVSPTGNVSPGTWLTYTVRFQNTGTAPAVNILVTDTLSSYVDPATFQLLSYSADNLTQVFGNVVKFNFPNINLPDSTHNEPNSHGYVQYKVKVKDNAPNNASVANTAYIYFDFNAPVVTNTTQNLVNTPCTVTTSNITAYINCGDSVVIGNNVHKLTGVYFDTLQNTQGCDSLVTLHLTAFSDTLFDTITLCAGDSFYFRGLWVRATGNYVAYAAGPGGCDTLVKLNSTVLGSGLPTNINANICSTDSFLFNGTYLHSTGTYTAHYTNRFGCDSTVRLQLGVLLPDTTAFTHTICSTDSFLFAGQYRHTAGYYQVLYTNIYGCDSLATLQLTVHNTDTTLLLRTICSTDSFLFAGQYRHNAGMYNTHLSNRYGCDSLVILSLTVNAADTTTLAQTICSTDSVLFNGHYLRQPGSYTAHFSNIHACDSLVTLQLSTRQPDTLLLAQAICLGDTFTFNGIAYTQNGNYTDTLTNRFGCDSIVTLALTINPLPAVSFSIDSLIGWNGQADSLGRYFICSDAFPASLPLTGGIPAGGVYSGKAVHNNLFYFDSVQAGALDTITYRYTNSNSCSNTATILFYYTSCTGIKPVANNIYMDLYPNPANNEVTIEVSNTATGGDIQLTNVSGQIINQFQVHGSKFQINTTALASGVYFVKLTTSNNQTAIRKLVVER
ncbi:MAG TPA: T9SS type A sorting domain-containing protein, partial [Chitinophagales bacterium]|nr:T9SS type A sorting domain-containing protein [Chitinophagales bacterium]